MSRALQLNVASSCVLPVKSVTTSILTTRQHTSYGVFIYSSTIPIHTFFCCSIQMVLVCVCVCDVYMVLVLVRSPFARATPIQTLCIFLSLETIVQRPPPIHNERALLNLRRYYNICVRSKSIGCVDCFSRSSLSLAL